MSKILIIVKKELLRILTDKRLCFTTIIMPGLMIFIMSFAGWVWEVSLHFLTKGCFVNRGVLHGPWLPIYGAGSVLI